MEYFIWTLMTIFILTILYFAVGAYAALMLTKVGDHPQYDRTPGSFGLAYETIHFPSRGEQLKLAAWYVPKEGAAQAVILVHGRNASKQNAISGNFPKLASELHQAGYCVLVLDMRGHGESEGKRYTWGIQEKKDILGAVDDLLSRGFEPGAIYVLGISLGGAGVLFAAAEEPAIGAVVVDSTFASLDNLVKPNWREESGLPMFFLPSVHLMWKIVFGFSIKDVQPVAAIKAVNPRPILIFHSTSDEIIPVKHAHQLAEAAQQAHLFLFEQGDHAELYRDHPQTYLKTLTEFLKSE